jgi:heme exporter protein C
MMLTFLVALVGMALLFVTLCKYEIASKLTRGQIRALRRKLSGERDAVFSGRSAAPQVHA